MNHKCTLQQAKDKQVQVTNPGLDNFCLIESETINILLGDPEVTANMYCNFAYPYWEGCVICSIYLR